jgi:hypothetical protein
MVIQDKHNKKIAIITAYRVCNASIPSLGYATAAV